MTLNSLLLQGVQLYWAIYCTASNHCTMHMRLSCSKHCTTRLNNVCCVSQQILHDWVDILNFALLVILFDWTKQEYLHTLDYSMAVLIIARMWTRVQTLYNWFGDSCTNDLQWFLFVVQYASTNVVCTACFRHDGRSDTLAFGTQQMHKYFTKTVLIRLCEQARFCHFRCWNQCVCVQHFGCLLCLNGCLAVDNFASI